ncbi:MAG: precorrin-2 C(20)-methyltransferase [Magnetococcales bacterium]|nr:precorrin-2 C(20)-methyltransferase [Magnetococcales bacterium]
MRGEKGYQAGRVGRLIGASLGPGDPGWITRAAWDALENSPCWAWPVSRKNLEGYALAIAKRAGLQPPEGSLALDFPMVRDPARLASSWQAAAEAVIPRLRGGEDVAFLVEGDASFFATFGYLAQYVRALDPSIEIEVIPGVSSPNASAALAGIPLAEGEGSLAIHAAPSAVARLDQLLEMFQTVVLLKVRPVLDELIALLEQRALLERAIFVERVGAPEQRVVTDVSTLRGERVHYLSLLIIRSHPAQ